MSQELEKECLVEVRLNFVSNRLKTNEVDVSGKTIYKARGNWVAKIVAEGGKNKYVFVDKGPLYAPKYSKDGTIFAGQQSYPLLENGIYKAREADKFDKTEVLEHTFTVENGKIVHGTTKKLNSGKDVDGGFSLAYF